MMLTFIRRVLLIPLLGLLLVGFVLLMNVGWDNPTGRRYSSDNPAHRAVRTGEDDWLEAENILERDLGIPLNDRDPPRSCLCSAENHDTAPGRCNVCIMPPVNISQQYTLPDFITNELIADSKYRLAIVLTDQISDFITAAEETNREVWLYVRTDTVISPSLDELVEATGGDIVPYFVVDGYADPIDQIARILLIVGGSGVVIILGWEVWRWLRSSPSDPHEDDESPGDEVDKAVRTVDETEAYMRRIERLSRKEIDKKDDGKR